MPDLLDMASGFLDALGVAKDGDDEDSPNLDKFTKAADFILTISDKEERRDAMIKALQQSYEAGVKSK